MSDISRRAFGTFTLAALVAGPALAEGAAPETGRFGQINKLTAKPARASALRGELAGLIAMLDTALLYELLDDPAHPDLIWTIELWKTAAAHQARVAMPDVQAAIGRLKPLVARFENIATFDTASKG